MGLYVFSLPVSLLMTDIIYILCLIIIIKSEVWTITRCLGLGHKKMVSTVCLSIYIYLISSYRINIIHLTILFKSPMEQWVKLGHVFIWATCSLKPHFLADDVRFVPTELVITDGSPFFAIKYFEATKWRCWAIHQLKFYKSGCTDSDLSNTYCTH